MTTKIIFKRGNDRELTLEDEISQDRRLKDKKKRQICVRDRLDMSYAEVYLHPKHIPAGHIGCFVRVEKGLKTGEELGLPRVVSITHERSRR